ncbi:hypothetical protein [Mesorhizobium sp.]|uniref:hypothetical protein n=1 Tax=Mesorhizobium sp. TaxID=1871066 RepID=UPI00344E3B30
MKILSLLKVFSSDDARRNRHDGEITRWIVDPLSHPVFDTIRSANWAMSPSG